MPAIIRDTPHWYNRDGDPAHILNAEVGTPRGTTIKDARKLGLLPSVTNVLSVIARPGLERWKLQTALDVSAIDPRKSHESLDEYRTRVQEAAQLYATEAAAFGTRMHAHLSALAESRDPEIDPSHPDAPFFYELRSWFQSRVEQVLWTETVLVMTEEGFAGRADMLCMHREHGLVLLDLKTKEGASKRQTVWPEWLFQLAAYARATRMAPNCMSLVMDSKVPAQPMEKLWTPAETEWGWEVFRAAHLIWRNLKGYNPIVPGHVGVGTAAA